MSYLARCAKMVLMMVLGFSLISCVSGPGSPPSAIQPEAKTAESPVPQEAWEKDWQKTLAAARREEGR